MRAKKFFEILLVFLKEKCKLAMSRINIQSVPSFRGLSLTRGYQRSYRISVFSETSISLFRLLIEFCEQKNRNSLLKERFNPSFNK